MNKTMVNCVVEGCNVKVHVTLAEKTNGVCPKCNGTNQTKTNTNKGEVNMNKTNKVVGMEYVAGKALIIENGEKKQVSYNAAIKMTIVNGSSNINVTFGYSPMGGQQTFYRPEGKGLTEMSRADFVKRLKAINIANFNQVNKMLSGIRYVKKDSHIIGKCDCCKKNFVTTANMDFVQKAPNRERIEKATGFKPHMFSKLCYECQGAGPRPEKKKPVQQSTTTDHASCHKCGKEVKSQKVIEYSLKKFGIVLCYHPCQKNYKPEDKAKAPVNPVEETPVTGNEEENDTESTDFTGLTPGMIKEIMALDVDPYSELAILKQALKKEYAVIEQQELRLWDNEHSSHVEKCCPKCKMTPCVCNEGASEASATPQETDSNPEQQQAMSSPVAQDELCNICFTQLPDYKVWEFDMCPSCVVDPSPIVTDNYEIPEDIKAQAKTFLEGASEASASHTQEEAIDENTKNTEDTKEEPQDSQDEGAVCSSGSIAGSKHDDFLNAIEYTDADVPPMNDSTELPY